MDIVIKEVLMCEKIRELEIFHRWESYNIEKENYVLLGAAILLCYGIRRQISDLDIVIIDDVVWEKFARDKLLQGSATSSEKLVVLENKTIEVGNGFLQLSFPDHPAFDFRNSQNITKIGDLKFMSLDSVEVYKNLLSRPKDLSDLQMIAEYRSRMNAVL